MVWAGLWLAECVWGVLGTNSKWDPNNGGFYMWVYFVSGILSVVIVGLLIFGLVKEKPALLLGVLIYIPVTTAVELVAIVLGIVLINKEGPRYWRKWDSGKWDPWTRQAEWRKNEERAYSPLLGADIQAAMIGGSAVLAIVGIVIIIIKINVWIPIYKTRKYFVAQRTNSNTMSMS